MAIRLLGFRCTGKTSVGRALARQLCVPFWDTDELVESRTAKSIREIVADEGWGAFRSMEREVVLELLELDSAVIALGGGAVLHSKVRKALRAAGLNVWLQASPKIILERMALDPQNSSRRPALASLGPEEEVRTLLREREPLYREVAHFRVITDHKCVEGIVRELLRQLGGGSAGRALRTRI